MIQKKEEIAKAKNRSNYRREKKKIEAMKKLLKLQAKMKKANIPVDTSVFNDDRRNPVNPMPGQSMKERLDKYQIEYDRLSMQLEYPSQRTRFKIIFGPTYSQDPSNKK